MARCSYASLTAKVPFGSKSLTLNSAGNLAPSYPSASYDRVLQGVLAISAVEMPYEIRKLPLSSIPTPGWFFVISISNLQYTPNVVLRIWDTYPTPDVTTYSSALSPSAMMR